jgi:heme/copper-type cytochrome/quinol oxidase subunit 3
LLTLSEPGFAPPRSRRLAHNGALGMALFVFAEVMLFAGFISAFAVVQGSALPGMWPPAGQPRLPVGRTALNTAALLASGVLLFVGARRFRRIGAAAAQPWMLGALGLGAAFVLLQGMEWVALLRHGLTLTSSQLGSFFYVIIGAHGLHAVAAILALGWSVLAMRARRLNESTLGAVELFWYFVVLVWPLLYWKVYL